MDGTLGGRGPPLPLGDLEHLLDVDLLLELLFLRLSLGDLHALVLVAVLGVTVVSLVNGLGVFINGEGIVLGLAFLGDVSPGLAGLALAGDLGGGLFSSSAGSSSDLSSSST